MLTIVPLKEQVVKKMIFLCGLKLWVWKIIYQRMDILDTCLGLMKMVESKPSTPPRVKLEPKSSKSNNVSPSSKSKGWNKCKWHQGKSRLHDDKEKSLGKESTMKKIKWDLLKVKCFNCDNHEHLGEGLI
jgi:hypothetical protein